MRTTIDLPEDLLLRAKAVAALRGVKMNDLIREFVQSGLGAAERTHSRTGTGRPIPVTIPADGRGVASLTNTQMFDAPDGEGHAAHDPVASPRYATPQERIRAMDALAEKNVDLPILSDSAFDRENIYEDSR